MDLGLAGRSVMVTGGSKGIGRAVALRYASEGARVALTYATDRAGADGVVSAIRDAGGEASAYRLDLADPRSIVRAVQDAADHLGGLDVLVANAVRWANGAERRPLATVETEAWTSVVRANLEGTAITLRTALPHLMTSAAGRIVLISSIGAHHGAPGATAYAASKAALEGLAAALKFEAGEAGVLVNIVSPGITLTDRLRTRMDDKALEEMRLRTPTRRHSTDDDVARTVVFFGSSGNTNVTGVYVSVSGGFE